MKTNLIRLGGLAAILAGMALHKKSKIFVSDVELQKEFANSSPGWLQPWEMLPPRILNSEGVGELLQSSSGGTLVIPGLETPGLKLANAFGVRLVQSWRSPKAAPEVLARCTRSYQRHETV